MGVVKREKVERRREEQLMFFVLTVSAAILTGSFAFASSVDAEGMVAQEVAMEENRELEVYDSAARPELEAVDIVVAAGYGFDVEHDFEGISYNESAVRVSYYADRGSFDGNRAGKCETYYNKVVPVSGKEPYLLCRTISVREPETAKEQDSSSNFVQSGVGKTSRSRKGQRCRIWQRARYRS